MAVIQKNAQFAHASKLIPDWSGAGKALSWPAGLSYKDRIELYRRGRKDARRGLVSVNEYGELTSAFCESLVHAANHRIALEWGRCIDEAAASISFINQAELQIADLKRKIRDTTLKKGEALEAIRKRHYDGDDAVSEHLARRRQERRVQPVQTYFDNLSAQLHEELIAAELSVIPYQSYLAQIGVSAHSHEQLIRSDYLWRLSAYAYGVSAYIKITPEMINDSALDQESSEQYEQLLSRYQQNTSSENDEQVQQ